MTTACFWPSARSIRPRRAASWVATTGDFSAAIRPGIVAKSALAGFGLAPLGRDPVDPAGGLVAEGVAADARVVPVGDEDRAVGRGGHVDGAEPGVVAGEEDLVVGPERSPRGARSGRS